MQFSRTREANDPRANLADLLKSIDQAAIGGVDFIVATELSLTPYFCIEKELTPVPAMGRTNRRRIRRCGLG